MRDFPSSAEGQEGKLLNLKLQHPSEVRLKWLSTVMTQCRCSRDFSMTNMCEKSVCLSCRYIVKNTAPPSAPRLSTQPVDQHSLTAGYYLWQLFQLGRHLQIKITVICVVWMRLLVCFILCFPSPTVLLTALGLSLPISVSLWMLSWHVTAPRPKPLSRQMALSGSRGSHVLPEMPAHPANDGITEIVCRDPRTKSPPRAIQGTLSHRCSLPGGLLDSGGWCAVTPSPPWSSLS